MTEKAIRVPETVKKHMWHKKYINNLDLILMALPGLVAFIVFAYMPMVGLLAAFQDFKILDGILGSDWVGVENFAKLFLGRDFPRALRNTFTISLLKLLVGFPVPVFFAIILNECRNGLVKKTVQTCSYLPHFFSWIVLSGIVKSVFSATGPVNVLLSYLGFEQPVLFFGSNSMFIVLIIITDIWKEAGWSSIIYLAAISGIDTSLYEAAEVDGAGRLRRIWSITLPALLPTIITMLILKLSSVLNVGIDQIYSLYNPQVYDVADILDTYLLRMLQTGDYSFGTAVGMFKSVVGMIFVLAGNKVAKLLTNGEQGII